MSAHLPVLSTAEVAAPARRRSVEGWAVLAVAAATGVVALMGLGSLLGRGEPGVTAWLLIAAQVLFGALVAYALAVLVWLSPCELRLSDRWWR